MRQPANAKRSRGRSGRNRPSSPRNHTFDSSGPEGKVRGTAHQVFEKYLALGRDAQSSGDRIAAENFFQHAEHYYRIMNGNQQPRERSQANGQPYAEAGPDGGHDGRAQGGNGAGGRTAEGDDDQAASPGESGPGPRGSRDKPAQDAQEAQTS